jgi:hypothetical protein
LVKVSVVSFDLCHLSSFTLCICNLGYWVAAVSFLASCTSHSSFNNTDGGVDVKTLEGIQVPVILHSTYAAGISFIQSITC